MALNPATQRFLLVWLPAFAFLILCDSLAAHAGHDYRLKTLILNDEVHLEVTLMAKELNQFGADGKGFTANEFEAARPSLEVWLDQSMMLYGQTGSLLAPYFQDLVLIHSASGTSNLKVRRRYKTNDANVLLVTFTSARSWLMITPDESRTGRL
ncbi:MAG: hypothetical protein AAGE43_17580, partial [Pseudomonadota bacterium]